MKNIYFLVVALFFYGFANAQVINFPDANFKAKLLSADVTNQVAINLNGSFFKIDANNNAEIEFYEAQQVRVLNVSSSFITSLIGISEFINLMEINCISNQITSLNLNSNLELRSLICYENQLVILDINNNSNLVFLNCSRNQLAFLNLNNNTNLANLSCRFNQLSSLNLENNTNLYLLECSDNQLTSLSVNNNVNLNTLYCRNNQLTYLNMNNDVNLNILDCSYNQLSYLNLSNNVNITKLDCYNNQLTSLNVNNDINLTNLDCKSNQLTSLNVSDNINLTFLECRDNQLPILNVINNVNLTFLVCFNNQLTSLNVNNNANLIILDCGRNQLTALDLSYNINLNLLGCNNNQITSLNVDNNVNLTDLKCSNNQLTSINLSNNTNLRSLICYSNQITFLNLDSNLNLFSLECYGNQLTLLNLNNNINIDYIYCNDNLLTSINLKNGKNEFVIDFSSNPYLQYICADDNQIQAIQNQIAVYGYTNCNVNSYCTFTPGGSFYSIQGNQKHDLNNNGCDALDVNLQNLKYNISDGTNSGSLISDTSGNYKISVQAGTHAITPIFENPTYFNVSPNTVSVTFPTQTSPVTQDFCITANGVHNDLEINLLPIGIARPGFDAKYKLIYKNKGNTVQSGNVNLNFNDSVLDLVSALPTVTTQTLNNLSWVFTNLQPFESREITFTLNVNSPMEIPAVNDGDILNYVATITSAAIDEMPNDNTFAYNQTVVNSFDPNDKTCLEGATISQTKVGDYVHYMIRFENNGTANAQNIVVKDMIDTTKFDVNSIVPIKGSHSFVTNISAGNKVEFIFENIQLPFDDANNDGYIAFKIKTKSTLVNGNSFSNTAGIYFDYNFPIVTNTATTTIQTLANQDFEFANYFSLYPNPVKDVLKIDFKETIELKSINIYNTLGQLVFVIPNAQNINNIDVSSLKSGNYFIKINSDKGTINSKFIKE